MLDKLASSDHGVIGDPETAMAEAGADAKRKGCDHDEVE